MDNSLKILLIEDDTCDAEIIQTFLAKEKPLCTFQRVMKEDEFLLALDEFNPDVVISDNALPQYSGMEALSAFKKRSLPIPFILVTGTVSEEFAVKVIEAGADDYLLKDRLVRLPAAIDAAIQKKKAETERKLGEDRIRFKANLLRSVGQAVIATDMQGSILYWNHVAEHIFGWKAAEVMGKNIIDITCEDQGKHLVSGITPPLNKDTVSSECSMRRKDGSFFPAFLTESPFYDDLGNMEGIIGVSYDLTQQKEAEKRILDMEKQIAVQKIQEERRIARAIINAQEEEKNHIGKELHDNINQILAGAKMFMGMAGSKNKEVKELLKYPIELLENSMEEIRRLTHTQVTPLENINLKSQLNRLLESLKLSTAHGINFAYSVPDTALSDDLKLNIYRIVQEQLNNIVKHAHAKNIFIDVVKSGASLTVTIKDDGKGFDTMQERKGIGISNMMNRVQSYDGTFTVASKEGEGCVITVQFPV